MKLITQREDNTSLKAIQKSTHFVASSLEWKFCSARPCAIGGNWKEQPLVNTTDGLTLGFYLVEARLFSQCTTQMHQL